jgi:hypothetical protein
LLEDGELGKSALAEASIVGSVSGRGSGDDVGPVGVGWLGQLASTNYLLG